MNTIKTTARRAIVAAIQGGLAISGETGRRLLAEATALNGETMIEKYEIAQTPYGALKFYCLGELSLYRVRTLFTKEPETIEWIDTFDPASVFWDIGANIGLYSIYAAARGCQTLAFEPSAPNYFLLNRNIEANAMDNRVMAYCLAFADATVMDFLNMRETGLGGAMSSFASKIDEHGNQFDPSFRQGMLGYSIDEFVRRHSVQIPNHLKIDVDGIEDKIIAGGVETLAKSEVRSISLELDADRDDYVSSVTSVLASCGLRLASKRHAPMFDNSEHRSIYNYLFAR